MMWWAWLVLGFALAVAEMFTAGLFLMFFGAGAVIVGVLAWAGIVTEPWMQWLLFTVVSSLAVTLFRKPMLRRFQLNPKRNLDTMVGERARANEAIAVGAQGGVEMRGTVWKARNVGAAPIAAGEVCEVEQVDGIVLMVRGAAVPAAVATPQ